MKKSKIIFLILALIILITLSVALSFYVKNLRPEETDDETTVIVIFDYGSLKNPNYEEHNVTVHVGSSALVAFSKVADLQLTNYTFGSYVKGVNGYLEELPNYWAFYYEDPFTDGWQFSPYGISNYYLGVNSKIKLQYTG